MTLLVRTVALAEGIALDARGQVTLVGLEPQAWIPSEFPATIRFALAIVLESDRESESLLQPGAKAKVTTTVTAPDEAVLFYVEESHGFGSTGDLRLPPRMQIVASLQVTVYVAGVHKVLVSLKLDDDNPLEWSRDLRVLQVSLTPNSPGLISPTPPA